MGRSHCQQCESHRQQRLDFAGVNSEGINCWDADSAPFATIQVDFTWEIDIDTTTEIVDGGFHYDWKHTAVGSGTASATFTRESIDADNPANVTAGKFSIARGELIIPNPANGKFDAGQVNNVIAVPDGSPPCFRGVFCNIYPKDNTAENGPYLLDTTNSYSVDWTDTYTPTDGGPPIASDSGTVTDTFAIGVQLNQTGETINWILQGSFYNLANSDAFRDISGPYYDGAANGSESIGPITVTVENLKTGGDVDIGGVSTSGLDAPTNWDTVTTWVYTETGTIVCS